MNVGYYSLNDTSTLYPIIPRNFGIFRYAGRKRNWFVVIRLQPILSNATRIHWIFVALENRPELERKLNGSMQSVLDKVNAGDDVSKNFVVICANYVSSIRNDEEWGRTSFYFWKSTVRLARTTLLMFHSSIVEKNLIFFLFHVTLQTCAHADARFLMI